jgi:hypothetical protein
MHPDTIVAGLRRELARFPERREEIEAEIARVRGLPRPASTPEDPDTVADRRLGYLAGLERELARAVGSRREEIETEIGRVKAELRGDQTVERPAADPPVERAVADPAERGAMPRRPRS